MRKAATLAPLAILAIGLGGCEANGLRGSHGLANQIIDHADSICADRGKTANIAWMEGRTDDVVITCQDGSNHFYDG